MLMTDRSSPELPLFLEITDIECLAKNPELKV